MIFSSLGASPLGMKNYPLGFAISLHPSKWSCNNILLLNLLFSKLYSNKCCYLSSKYFSLINELTWIFFRKKKLCNFWKYQHYYLFCWSCIAKSCWEKISWRKSKCKSKLWKLENLWRVCCWDSSDMFMWP